MERKILSLDSFSATISPIVIGSVDTLVSSGASFHMCKTAPHHGFAKEQDVVYFAKADAIPSMKEKSTRTYDDAECAVEST